MRDKDTFIKKCLNAGISVFILLILLILAGNGEKAEKEAPEEQVAQDNDNSVIKEPEEDIRIIQVDRSKNGVCEKYTYQRSNVTEDELLKSFYKTRTEDGVSVRIVSYCDGEEKVLTDCEYNTVQFPYYFERYFNAADADDIFNSFYRYRVSRFPYRTIIWFST